MENVYSALDEVVQSITSSYEYQQCIALKKQMNDNKDLMDLIVRVKELQKKYIRSGYDSKIKKELNQCVNTLMEIPIYYSYQKYLEKINEMIDYVKESLNDYFSNILNS